MGTIRERLTELLGDWGTDVSMLLNELEEKRAHLQKLEAEAAARSHEIEALNERVEAQDTLIESLQSDVDETVSLKVEIREKDLELEKRSSEIDSKHELIGALRRGAVGIGQLKGVDRAKDREIARLTKEKQRAEKHAAELTQEFKILTVSTLTGIDSAAQLEAVRAELDARKGLIESLRGDAERAQALEAQLEEKRFVITTLETSIDRHARTISELQQSVAVWRRQFAALNSDDPAAKPAIAAALAELSDDELQAQETAEDVSGEPQDPTTPVTTPELVVEAQQTARTKTATNR